MDLTEIILAAGVVLFAYLVRGLSGFGSALVAVPLLAHFLPLTFVVPWIALMDVLGSLLLARSGHRGGHIQWREVGWLLPAAVVGVVLGINLLVSLPESWLLGALGLFVFAFGIRSVFGLHSEKPVSQWWALPTGVIGGAISALFSTGGPPFVIYLGHRLRDKSQFRATLSGLFLLEGSIRVAGLLIAGLYAQPDMLLYLLAGLPLMVAGLWLGHHIHVSLTQRQMMVTIGLLLSGSGASLLWRVFSS